MAVGQDLLQAQSARFAAVDPLLPPAAVPPDGDVITAALPDGRRVAGVVVHEYHGPGSLPSLWSAREVWELSPMVGSDSGAGLDALLRVWRGRMDALRPGDDSACVVTWPSRDAEAIRALLDHGFVPLSVIAVRPATPVPPPAPDRGGPTVTVRRAGPGDLPTVLALAQAELEYSALVGGTVLRPDSGRLKRQVLAGRLYQGDHIWLAERDGVPVGLAECGVTYCAPGNPPDTRLPVGRWGYVNCVAVRPDARSSGVGQRLMAAAHHGLRRAGVTGTYLYYNPTNPLSSVFWIRQGYRPLWTIWEVRPARALR